MTAQTLLLGVALVFAFVNGVNDRGSLLAIGLSVRSIRPWAGVLILTGAVVATSRAGSWRGHHVDYPTRSVGQRHVLSNAEPCSAGGQVDGMSGVSIGSGSVSSSEHTLRKASKGDLPDLLTNSGAVIRPAVSAGW